MCGTMCNCNNSLRHLTSKKMLIVYKNALSLSLTSLSLPPWHSLALTHLIALHIKQKQGSQIGYFGDLSANLY